MELLPQEIDKRYERVLTFKDLILLGLSMTIGSGIFVLIDDVAKYAGNLAWFSMFLAGIMSLLTAFSYGELAGMFRNNMGEYGYFKAVTGTKVAGIVGLCILISDVFIISTVALGLGNYVSKSIGFNVSLIAIIALASLNYVNYSGIRISADVSNIALYTKLGVVLLTIMASFLIGSPQENLVSSTNASSSGMSTAVIIALFAYLGFNNMTNFAEETVEPEVNIGKSMTWTVGIITVLYTVLVISCLFVLTSGQLSKTTTPLADVINKLFGSYGSTMFMILAIISLIDTLLVTCVSESRYIHAFISNIFPSYGQADMNEKHKTPYISITLLVVLSIAIIMLFQNIGTTAIYGDSLLMIVFILVNLVVIVLRYNKPEINRPFKVPFSICNLPVPSVLAIFVGIYAAYYSLT